MQKYVNTADSYRRENPENTLVKEKIASGKVEAEKNTFDKSDTAKDTPDQEEAKKASSLPNTSGTPTAGRSSATTGSPASSCGITAISPSSPTCGLRISRT